jgi:hypothetical protein
MIRLVTLIVLAQLLVFAQPNIDKKLQELKGDIKKITLKTDKGELAFEGNEAEQLFSRLKKPHNIMMRLPKMNDSCFAKLDSIRKEVKVLVDDSLHKKVVIINGDTIINTDFNFSECFSGWDSSLAHMGKKMKFFFKGFFGDQPGCRHRHHGEDDEDCRSEEFEWQMNDGECDMDNEDVEVIGDNGADNSEVIIIENHNGQKTVKVLSGQDAEAIIKQHCGADNHSKPEKPVQKKIIIKKQKQVKKD